VTAELVRALVQGVLTGGIYALMAAGLTLLFGVLDIINVAAGILVVLGAYGSMMLLQDAGINIFVGLLVTVPAMCLLGAFIDVAFIRRLGQYNRVTMSVMVTYAVAIIIEGILALHFGTNYQTINTPLALDSFHVFGIYVAQIYVYGFLLAVVCLGLLGLGLFRTRIGRSIRAVMDNGLAAELVGIDVRRVATITFAIGIGVTAVGGMVFGSIQPFTPNTGYDLISRLLSLVVLGGLGSVGGAMAGALIMLVAEDVVAVVWAPTWAPVLYFAVLALVILLRPQGLFGSKDVRAQ
jgi:branched-chain amino acid transport system permease protein